ncbi:MAG: AAA family ATPase [Candidatus Omnitrophota bacterium]
MYEQFYGFKEKPFNNNPDPRFFYPSPKHAEALNRLLYAVQERKGFIVVTGEIGSGKTTVCRALLKKIDEEGYEVCLITNTHLSSKELIIAILEDLRVPYKSGTKVKLLAQLNDFLLQKMQEGKNIILIVDEAQNLTPSVLEEVRMLSNLETDTEKLMQIILIGQPQLREKLKLKDLEQFRQRIAVHYHLYPLSMDEMVGYINHRLGIVLQNGDKDIFSPEAMQLAFEFSKGVPRLINYACDSALLSGFVYEKKQIDQLIMHEAVNESHLKLEDEKATTQCCPQCQQFEGCQTRECRSQKGEEQLCCQTCLKYHSCH